MRSLVFGKRWRKAGEGTSGKNETDCSGKRRILRKRERRISEEGEADCLWGRKNLRKRVKRISEKSEAYCPEKRKFLRKRKRRISEEGEADCLLGKEKPPNAREEDFHGGRSGLLGEKERGDLGKVSFWCGKRSTLHVLAQHAASANAARCVSHRTALRFSPHPSPSCPKAPSPSPPSASRLPCPRAGHHREGL